MSALDFIPHTLPLQVLSVQTLPARAKEVMMDVHWEEHVHTTIQELRQADATFVGAISILPRSAQDQSWIPQNLHLQICLRIDGHPVGK
eukprot:12919313-Prorocentrum_lima.AAC.1